MKRLGLLLAVVWFNGLYANFGYPLSWHRIEEPVKVRERSIDFYIFPDGTFDFNAHGRHYHDAGFMGVRIERDHFGKIRRVGNVFINYNRYGQVSRIGRLFIKYNRRGLVERIGRRYIRYRRNGYYVISHHRPRRPGYVYGTGFYYYGPSYNAPIYDDTPYFDDDNDDEGTNYNDDDDNDNYYYRPSTRKNKAATSKKQRVNRRRS